MFYKIFSILSVVAVGLVLVQSQKVCPPNANGNPLMPCALVNGTCYCVASQKPEDGLFLRWAEADAFCQSINMSLVSLETEEKDWEVINTINQLCPPYPGWTGYLPYWTSGRYVPNNGIWYWTGTDKALTWSPPSCCMGPPNPCTCPTLLDPSNGEAIINHNYNHYDFWYWDTANETEALHPFTCEGRNYV